MWEKPSRATTKHDVGIVSFSKSLSNQHSKGFDVLYRCNLFGFCDPYKNRTSHRHCHDKVETHTLPFSPLSYQEPSLRDITVEIHHHQAYACSTPNHWESTAVSTVSPLTSPRELRHQNGTYLESSGRRLFTDEEDDECTWMWSSWKFMLCCLLIPLVVFAVYYRQGSAVTLLSTRVWDATARWWEAMHSQWSVVESQVRDLCAKDAIGDVFNDPSTSPDPPFIHPLSPSTSTGTPSATPLSNTDQDVRTTTFQSLHQSRLIMNPLPLALIFRSRWRTFLEHQFRQRGHWLIPLASTMIPGMGWVLLMAILARLIILGT